MRAVSGFLLTAALCLLATACGEGASAGADPRRLALSACPPEDRIPDGLCGTLTVYEDRERATGRQIDLRIVVLPALSGAPTPDPVFILAGGPGQAASEIVGAVTGAFREIHRTRDLVFVDQRGTGESNPLECDLDDGSESQSLLMDPLVDTLLMAQTLDRLRACADSLPADPRLYTTPIAMDDLDDVREALGYERINLWGASYGTRAALVYMRRHPEHVRTAILDGLAPPAIRLPLYMGRDGNRALELMLADCADSPGCSAAYPRLAQEVEDLLASLEAAPFRTTVRHPRTGEPTEVTVTRTSVASVIRGTLYNPYLTALLPLAIHEAASGRLEPLASLSLAGGGGESGIHIGMFLSVVCSEDLPQITAADRAEAEADRLFGTRLLEAFEQMCGVWPKGELDPGYADPVSSHAPVLLLSGNLDPVTPPGWADYTAQTLANALQVIVPGSAHNVFAEGCVPEIMEAFVTSASTEELDVACASQVERPPFFDSPIGPGTRESR